MTRLHADDAFLSYYQFSHDPFAPRVPGFKFYPAQRKSVLGQLHHLARYGQLLLLVTGPRGSGKTLLRQALVASTNKQAVQSLVISGRDSTTYTDVLAQIARGVGPHASTAEAILSRAGQLSLTGQEVYLLVDDAGLLEDRALELLLALSAGNGEGRLHVFLFADADLEARLNSLVDGEAGCHCLQLQPYTVDESSEYLAQRLEGAGQSLDLLTDEQLADIHERSGGWPGLINQIAHEVMVDSMLAHKDEMRTGNFSFRLPRKHVLALLVVFAAVAGVWMLKSEAPADLPRDGLAVNADAQSVDERKTNFDVEFSSADGVQPQVAQPVIREPLAMASVEEGLEEYAGASEGLPDAGENTPSVAVETVAVVPLPLPTTPEPLVAQVDGKVVVSGGATNQVQPSGALADAAPVVLEPAVAVARPQVLKPTPKLEVPAQAKSAATIAPAGTGWYRSQSSALVALQILGTRSESNAKVFVKQHGSDYHYYMKMHQGAPLYVVTYGVFSSRAAAQAALKALPAKIQASKPWPKTFASIQQEIIKGQ